MKKSIGAALAAVLVVCVAALSWPPVAAWASEAAAGYIEQYRPQLTYTPKNNWNNDPNGLVYADTTDDGIDNGLYHMYYQYATTGNQWDTMHWGHAVSGDLVRWEERPVAILPNMPGWDNYDASAPAGPIFSGSCVYVSARDIAAGREAYNGPGFYAVFTQPDALRAGAGDQRQCVAYSADGERFETSTFREVLPNDFASDGTVRGDFRDPKVFWDDTLGKWLMVVGGGEILMFVSEDLASWSYLGSTGFWGECPDLFPLKAGEEEKWVLVLSPEDKPQSHEYNGTDRATHEYPNEFYIVGDRTEDGLFTAEGGENVKQLSFAADSYAVQTFNGAPDGKRIGISWAANWKTVGEYAEKSAGGLRENWNGGMTMAYELGLAPDGEGWQLTKNPVAGYEDLRAGDALYSGTRIALGSENVLSGVRASLAEVDVTLDVAGASATEVVLELAAGTAERTVIRYDIAGGTLSLDRSRSSLAARGTSRYQAVYRHPLAARNGKVRIRAYLDWGYVHVFGGNGEASATAAIFPSLASSGMSLTANGGIEADVSVHALSGIWNNESDRQAYTGFYLSASDESLAVGERLPVLAGSPNPAFSAADVRYTVTGGTAVTLDTTGAYPVLVGAEPGMATVLAEYGGAAKRIDVTVYSGTAKSDLNFSVSYAGRWVKSDGYLGESAGDGFLFTEESYADLKLSATITAADADAQAAGIVFAAGEDHYTYYCANYDYRERTVKVWISGGETLASAPLSLRRGDPVRYEVSFILGDITVSVNGTRVLSVSDGRYSSGRVGLNVYNGAFRFDDIVLTPYFPASTPPSVRVDGGVRLVENVTDLACLSENSYAVENGVLRLDEAYLSSLRSDTEYELRVTTEDGRNRSVLFRTPRGAVIRDPYQVVESGMPLSVLLETNGAQVLSVTVNGREVGYAFDKSVLSISADALKEFSGGDYTLAVATDRGVVAYVFGYKVIPPVPVDPSGRIISIVAACAACAAVLLFGLYWLVGAKQRA